jgi:hypothetical protein
LKKVTIMAALCGLLMLALAGPAAAQSFTDQTPQVGNTCPEGYAAFGDPGTGELNCFTQEDLAAVERGELTADDLPVAEAPFGPGYGPATSAQYAPSNLTGTGQYLVGADDGVCVGEGEGDPDCAQAYQAAIEASAGEVPTAAQYATPEAQAAAPAAAPEAAPTASAEGLPSTGGAPLLPIAACLLVGAWLLGTLAWRR